MGCGGLIGRGGSFLFHRHGGNREGDYGGKQSSNYMILHNSNLLLIRQTKDQAGVCRQFLKSCGTGSSNT